MKHVLLPRFTATILLAGLLCLAGPYATLAQDAPVGGPYTVDENTIVLMHFDGNAENASDSTADGQIEGNVTFTADSPLGSGQSAYFDNSTSTRSLVSIADTAALDLTADWTLETWVRTSFGRAGPRLIMKPGDPAYQTNYYYAIEDRGGGHAHRGFRTGYRGQGNQFSADHIIQDDTWYHVTYIRDTTNAELIQVVRGKDRNLIWYGRYDINSAPTPTDQPLFLGGHPGVAFLRLTGNMDEVRISNSVRSELIPDASTVSNQVATGQTGVVFDTLDARVTFSDGSDSDGRLTGIRINAAPAGAGFYADSSATSDDGTVVVPDEVVSSGYWLLGDRELTTFEYEGCLSAGQVSDTTSPTKLVVVKRASPSDKWDPLDTSVQDVDGTTYLCAAGLTSAGGFAIAVDRPPLPPAIEQVTQFEEVQSVDAGPYPVEADVEATDDAVQSVTLHFATDGGAFQSTEMTSGTQGDTLYTAEIPSQEVGTVVQYYVTAEDSSGRVAYAPEGAEGGNESYLLYVGESESLVLHLAFEDGSGVPVDSSAYDHTMDVQGDPTYITDAPRGNGALAFDGEDDFLEVPPPALFLANEEFTVSFWLKVDSLKELHGRILIKEGGHGRTNAWFKPNYQFFANNENGILRGVPYNGEFIGGQMELSKAVSPDTWYLAILQATQDSAFFQVRNLDGSIFDEVGTGLAQPAIPTKGPFRVAAALSSNRPYFEGMIDDVRVYNYAADIGTIVGTDTEEGAELPQAFSLSDNYPNPFDQSTTIEYALPSPSDITLSVYDVLGRKVTTLVDQKQSAGTYQVTFSGDGLANGVYFYRLETGKTLKVRKMMLIK